MFMLDKLCRPSKALVILMDVCFTDGCTKHNISTAHYTRWWSSDPSKFLRFSQNHGLLISHSMSLVKPGEEEQEQTMEERRCQHWPKWKVEFLGPLSQNCMFWGEENWPRTGNCVSGGRRVTRRWEFRTESFTLKVSFVMLEISYLRCPKFRLDNEHGTFWLHNQFIGFIFLQGKCWVLSLAMVKEYQ